MKGPEDPNCTAEDGGGKAIARYPLGKKGGEGGVGLGFHFEKKVDSL